MSFRDFMGSGAKTLFYEYFNDFIDYTAGDWVITTTEAGGGSASEASIDEPFGALLVTNDSNDNDADFFQLVRETFKFVSGKRLYFGVRFKTSEATQTDFNFGLEIRDTTPLAVTDGIWFGKDDGDVKVDFHVAKNSTQTDEADIATLVDDTYITLEFYYDGSLAQFQLFVDGSRIAGVPLTNVPDDENLTVSFGIQNGTASAHTMTVDWIRAFVER